MATILTAEALAGQRAEACTPNPFMYSSPAWLAFQAGWSVSGMSTIKRATMGRGYTVNIETTGGNKVVVRFSADLSRAMPDRI